MLNVDGFSFKVLTPSTHMEAYSPDDNRFDHRPFLYRANWSWQFKKIDDELDNIVCAQKQSAVGGTSAGVADKSNESDVVIKSESLNQLTEKQSPIIFGPLDGSVKHHDIVTTNGGPVIGGACSSGNICALEKSSGGGGSLKKSHSTGYNKVQVNVMGKIKDRTGVPV